MTTVTGLPSTPSRNASVHPQASVALNVRLVTRPVRCRVRRGQNLSDVFVEEVLVLDPFVFEVHRAVRADEPRNGNHHGRLERFLHAVIAQGGQDRIVHLERRGELPQVLVRWIVGGDPDHGEALVPVLLLQLDQHRNFVLAGQAPRRPEVQEHGLPLEGLPHVDVFPVHVLEGELQVGDFRALGWRRVSRARGPAGDQAGHRERGQPSPPQTAGDR